MGFLLCLYGEYIDMPYCIGSLRTNDISYKRIRAVGRNLIFDNYTRKYY